MLREGDGHGGLDFGAYEGGAGVGRVDVYPD